jgi:hypothetical protein
LEAKAVMQSAAAAVAEAWGSAAGEGAGWVASGGRLQSQVASEGGAREAAAAEAPGAAEAAMVLAGDLALVDQLADSDAPEAAAAGAEVAEPRVLCSAALEAGRAAVAAWAATKEVGWAAAVPRRWRLGQPM